MATKRQARRRAQRKADNKNPLLDPAAPLAGHALKKAATQLVNLQTAPQSTAINRAISKTRTQGGRLAGNASDYYRQIAQDEQGRIAQRQAIASRLQSAIAGTSQQAQQGLSQAAATAQAANTGPGLAQGYGDPRTQAELAAAGGRSAAATQDASLNAAASTADYDRLAGLGQTATAMQGGETQKRLLTQLATQIGDLRTKKTDLAATRGGAITKAITDMRQQGFENAVTAKGLDIKLQTIAEQNAESKRNARVARRRIRSSNKQNAARLKTQRRGQDVTSNTTRRGQDVTKRGQDLTAQQRAADRRQRAKDNAANRKARSKDGKTKESTDASRMRTGINNLRTDLSNDPQLSAAARSGNWSKVRQIVNKRTKGGAPPLVVQAAIELQMQGYVSPTTLRMLQQAGMRVPAGWKRSGAQSYTGPH